MKSQLVRTRNLPKAEIVYRINVKPTIWLGLLIVVSIGLLFLRSYFFVAGLMMLMICVFSLTVMPDHTLCAFTNDFLILYNKQDRHFCQMIYWDEIVQWRYESYPMMDYLMIDLEDGSLEMLECYSPYKICKYMNQFAKGKQRKD